MAMGYGKTENGIVLFKIGKELGVNPGV